jgi:hypothetical protein
MLASLLGGLLSGETMEAARRARSAAIAYALAGLCGLFAIVFLLVAGYLALARVIGPVEAGLAIGAGFLVLAGLILLVHRLRQRRRIREDNKRRKSELIAVATTTAIAMLPTLARGKGGLLTLLAPAVAVVAYAIYRENAPRKDDPDRPPSP